MAEVQVKKKINPSFKERKLTVAFRPDEPLETMILVLREEMDKQKKQHEQEISRVSDNLRQIALILIIGSSILAFILGAIFF